jgi:hypothetical protein
MDPINLAILGAVLGIASFALIGTEEGAANDSRPTDDAAEHDTAQTSQDYLEFPGDLEKTPSAITGAANETPFSKAEWDALVGDDEDAAMEEEINAEAGLFADALPIDASTCTPFDHSTEALMLVKDVGAPDPSIDIMKDDDGAFQISADNELIALVSATRLTVSDINIIEREAA